MFPTDVAVDALLAAQLDDGSWPYRPGSGGATEPTAVAVMSLAALDTASPERQAALTWLATRRHDDGGFDTGGEHDEPNWVTALAGLACFASGDLDSAARAADWLLAEPVTAFARTPFAPYPYGYDTSLRGWPWTYGDFSFVEPTAFAMMLLQVLGRDDGGRVDEGVALLRDRTIAGGGWNFGEPEVFDTPLFADPAPTGIALIALQGARDAHTDDAIGILQAQRDSLSGPFSLGWAANAMTVYGLLDDAWQGRMESVYRGLAEANDPALGPCETALLLIAAVPRDAHPLAWT